MIWQKYATGDVLKGFSIRISDPDHISGPITAYAMGVEDLLAATRDYAATTTDRVQRQCVATLLLYRQKQSNLVECQHIYFNIPATP